VWCGDLKFESLNFSVDVVVASIGGDRFVKQVKEDGDKDQSRSKDIVHE
jgi:hypothetical protein